MRSDLTCSFHFRFWSSWTPSNLSKTPSKRWRRDAETTKTKPTDLRFTLHFQDVKESRFVNSLVTFSDLSLNRCWEWSMTVACNENVQERNCSVRFKVNGEFNCLHDSYWGSVETELLCFHCQRRWSIVNVSKPITSRKVSVTSLYYNS